MGGRSGISHQAATDPGRGITGRKIYLGNGSKLFKRTGPPLISGRNARPPGRGNGQFVEDAALPGGGPEIVADPISVNDSNIEILGMY